MLFMGPGLAAGPFSGIFIFPEKACSHKYNDHSHCSLSTLSDNDDLLSLPLRATRKVFYNAISPQVIKDFLNYYVNFFGNTNELEIFKKFIEEFDFAGKDFLVFDEINELEIEDFTNYGTVHSDSEDDKIKIEEYFKTVCKISTSNLAVFSDEIFSKICDRKMPVIARNNIGADGISKNLFYEEVLPRSTRLYFMVGEDITKNGKDYYQTTISKLSGNNEVFQFGANYSIGYGFSKLTLMAGGGTK